MANYFQLFFRGFKRKYLLKYLINLKETKIDVVVCSPGGCGNVTLNNHLEKYCLSNNGLTRLYSKKYSLMHLFKPLPFMIKRRIKIILIKRDLEEIYNSHKKRGFLRNSLIWYGDMFSFYKFKNEDYKKKKFISYLKKYYQNWETYPSDIKLEINYKDLWNSSEKIGKFLKINSPHFIETFPTYKPYKYD